MVFTFFHLIVALVLWASKGGQHSVGVNLDTFSMLIAGPHPQDEVMGGYFIQSDQGSTT